MAKRNVKEPEFPPVHVLVTGDREWDDEYILAILMGGFKLYHGLNIHLWEGEAPGADTKAKEAAKTVSGISVHPFPADWDRYKIPGRGNPAGPIRNQKMLDAMLKAASADPNSTVLAIALHDDLTHGGTMDMVKRLLKADVPVYVVSRPLLSELQEKETAYRLRKGRQKKGRS